MHTDELDLNLLAVFDALFREGSVTRAASHLGLTQSATSHALGRLRGFFDDPLFIKVGARMVPTPKAEGLRTAVLDVMGTVRQQILPVARFDPATARRVFTLCLTDMGELVFVPPLLQRLRTEAPGCTLHTLQVPIEQIESLLAAGAADLAIGSFRSPSEELYQQRLFLDTFATIASPKNTAIGERLSRETFEALPHVAVSLMGRPSDLYEQVLEDHGVRRRIAVTTPHFLMVPLMIDRQPDLIATVPLELAETFARLGVVRMFEPPIALPRFELKQLWHPRFHQDPALIWLRDQVKRIFESDPRAAG